MYEARLILFNKIMHHVPWQIRRQLILKLNRCRPSRNSSDESFFYKKESLVFDIYRSIKGEPYMQPFFACLTEIKDIKNRHLMEQIMSGINGYLKAPIEKQRAFQRNLLNPWTLKNMVARLKTQKDF